jgi:tellurite resistance protein
MLAVYLDEATRAAAAHVVRATTDPTGKVSPLVASVAVAAVRDADQSYDADRLASDLCGFDSTDTVALLTRLASELTAHGKQGFLRRMAQIAVADGSLNDRERRAVTEIGSTLGMAAPHINGVMAVAELQYLVA